MNAIEVMDLRREFTSREGPLFRRRKETLRAVDGISFTIGRGEIFSLLGPNGAGKTTTIKMLATLLLPSSGTALVDGFDIVKQDHRVRTRLAAVLPGERTLYWKLTVRENLLYFASLYGLDRRSVKPRIETMLNEFGIPEKRDILVEKLSTGQRQKVVLMRALLPDPAVLLLDEPTLGLDPVSAKNLRSLVRRASANGTTVLLTTHYMYEADELSDRVAIIHQGNIVCMDTPARLKGTIDACRILRFTADSWDDTLTKRFRSSHTAGKIAFERRNGSFTVEIESRETDFGLSELSLFCRRFGIEIHTVTIDEPSLEDVFIEKTGTALAEEKSGESAPVLR